MLNGTKQRVCGECRHWHRISIDPRNLTDVRGECRESPPALSHIPIGNGQLAEMCGYPKLVQNFMACSRYSPLTIVMEDIPDALKQP